MKVVLNRYCIRKHPFSGSVWDSEENFESSNLKDAQNSLSGNACDLWQVTTLILVM